MVPAVAGAQDDSSGVAGRVARADCDGAAGDGATPVTGYVANRQATGTKTDTPLIETPQSISVIPADQIRDQNAQSLNQAVRYTAGVTPETRGAVSPATTN